MKRLFLMWMVILLTAAGIDTLSAIPKKGADEVQRKASGVIDMQKNTAGNVELTLTNNGILGNDVEKNTGAGFWPRGSQNQYIFGSGMWFGAQKMKPDKSGMKNFVEISYNPSNGISWFVPGMVQDGDSIREDLKDKYRLYFSTDFNTSDGSPVLQDDGPYWPLWISDTTKKYQYGTYKHDYVEDTDNRNKFAYPMGPLFVSDEDIISIFKDTDLEFYDGGAAKRKAQGYPLGLQVQSNVYSWNKEDMKDVVIVSQIIENTSSDTLYNCWAAGFYDIDLCYAPVGAAGASNDRAKFFKDDEDLNLGVAWTETTTGEAGKNFGYIGISMLETPAVNDANFIRNDKLIFEPEEQLGLKTCSTNNIYEDIIEDDARYNYLSTKTQDADLGSGDKRMFLATGPFNMKPGDVARVVFAINFAMPAKGGEADGTLEDIAGFLEKAKSSSDNPQSDTYNNSLVGNLMMVRDRYYNKVAHVDVKDNDGQSNTVQVYPNPAGEYIYLNYESSIADGSEYEIFSVQGVKVAGGALAHRLNVSALTPGLYQLKIGGSFIKFIKL